MRVVLGADCLHILRADAKRISHSSICLGNGCSKYIYNCYCQRAYGHSNNYRYAKTSARHTPTPYLQ